MNMVMMSLAVGLATAMVFADGAVRTSYADPKTSAVLWQGAHTFVKIDWWCH